MLAAGVLLIPQCQPWTLQSCETTLQICLKIQVNVAEEHGKPLSIWLCSTGCHVFQRCDKERAWLQQVVFSYSPSVLLACFACVIHIAFVTNAASSFLIYSKRWENTIQTQAHSTKAYRVLAAKCACKPDLLSKTRLYFGFDVWHVVKASRGDWSCTSGHSSTAWCGKSPDYVYSSSDGSLVSYKMQDYQFWVDGDWRALRFKDGRGLCLSYLSCYIQEIIIDVSPEVLAPLICFL